MYLQITSIYTGFSFYKISFPKNYLFVYDLSSSSICNKHFELASSSLLDFHIYSMFQGHFHFHDLYSDFVFHVYVQTKLYDYFLLKKVSLTYSLKKLIIYLCYFDDFSGPSSQYQ